MSVAREHPVGSATAPAVSLLRLSALARCGGAMVVIAGLWTIVFWALASTGLCPDFWSFP